MTEEIPYSEHSNIEYATSFVLNFNSLREEDVLGTIWHPLWKLQLSNIKLVKEIVRIADLNPIANLQNKYTDRCET